MNGQRELDRLICSMQMMTRLPTPALASFTAELPTRASRYYPVAGWIVGAISAAMFWGASMLGNSLLAAILAISAGALVTGGFHEDGLADTADGLGGGQTPARRLEIMKDSRIGTYGGLALLLVTGLRIAALATFPPVEGAIALTCAHSVARAAPILVMRFGRYAGDPTAAKLPHTDMHVTNGELALAWALAILPTLLFPWRSVALALLATVVIAAFVAHRAHRLIDGFTGDVLGCIEQVSEAAILISLAWSLGFR
jgi:adenosylcobinamide-GDP ribazoletransferase